MVLCKVTPFVTWLLLFHPNHHVSGFMSSSSNNNNNNINMNNINTKNDCPKKSLFGIAPASLSSTSTSCTSFSSTALKVSIGLGPGEGTIERNDDDKMIYEIPDHELYRQSRLTDFDKKCDAWYESLLGSSCSSSSSATDNNNNNLGDLSEKTVERLFTPVELKDTIKLDKADPKFTAYVRKLRQPWMPIVPAFGCENYSVPVVRRRAEAWRHFDVVGMVETDYSLDVLDSSVDLILSESQQTKYLSTLQSNKAWLDDTECSARLVYINGRYCPSLSYKSSDMVRNLTPADVKELTDQRQDVLEYLLRIPDGFTDELVSGSYSDVESVKKECGTNLLSQLSAPHHNTGPATDQFAINNQQGMACFAALNSVKASAVSLIDVPANHEEDLPILILNAISKNGGIDVGDTDTDDIDTSSSSSSSSSGKGVAHHPRTLVLANEGSHTSIIQSTIDLDESDQSITPLPKLHNGYTQLFLHKNATVVHSYIEETGGIPTAKVDLSGKEYDEARLTEAQRPALKDTHLQCIDVHLLNEHATYKGTIMGLGGCGRSKIALTTTLLQPNTHASINGLSLSGGDQTVDMRTTIHHVAHDTVSRQSQKTMIGGKATATFKGRIRVEQSAQQTDSEQLARTLMLSDRSKIWAIPSLEIIADDVKCTHGATISDLSEEELFYLRSRGLDRTVSRNMLMYAFVDEVGSEVDSAFLYGEGKLKERIVQRLENLVPQGARKIQGEYSSV